MKLQAVGYLLKIIIVTPFVGVWIETFSQAVVLAPSGVTPFVGVWIETMLCV